ncbi:TPA: GNAT family N-acetyltransferase, partial [Campylobacter coli]|nr:GNAT family N-acetyltransferase [Campylobacter coli]HEH4526688.1 GNAT family N-acetyltransferase [Campylobacter coli]HEH4537547.1 GNAT family N-acetyltransferase [Campylobacter coli]HEH5174695.1 GNAT family N-acetyltransferase [Campylobacter coli]HEH5391456.1 GNAT family N-acetyltransferase [Campylobacter coli]
MKIKKYNLNSKDIWNNFNKDAKNGLFMFDRNYMDYH